MQQMSQVPDCHLRAFFPSETKAVEAVEKLHKAGFADDEIYQMSSESIGSGQFRQHGPDESRKLLFLQTQRSGPNPVLVIVFALIFALILGGLTFISTFALPSLHVGYVVLIGAAIGLALGAILGFLRRGRVRGDIGQETTAPPSLKQVQSVLNVIALRFTDSSNTRRTSQARAILIANGGKIDRSVGRLE